MLYLSLFFLSIFLTFVYFLRSKLQKRYARGLIIGKFYPPHKGHSFLIETALKHCKELVIILCQRPEEKPNGDIRALYLKEIFKNSEFLKEIIIIEDKYDANDSDLWAKLCIEWLKPIFGKYKPLIQVVFTSEKYGDPFAKYLSRYLGKNVKHFEVDISRKKVPISGFKIRENPYKYLNFLHPIVRNYYIKRVVFVGFEKGFARDLAFMRKELWVDAIENIALLNKSLCETGVKARNFVFCEEDCLIRAIKQKESRLVNLYREYRNKVDCVVYMVKKEKGGFYERINAFGNEFNNKIFEIKDKKEINDILSEFLR